MKKTVKIMVRIHVEQPLSNHRFPSEKPDGQGSRPLRIVAGPQQTANFIVASVEGIM